MGFHISNEFAYFYECIIRDSRGLTYMNALNPFKYKFDDIDLKGRFVNLFGDFSPFVPRLLQACVCDDGEKLVFLIYRLHIRLGGELTELWL